MQRMAQLHRQAVPDLLVALKEDGGFALSYVAPIRVDLTIGSALAERQSAASVSPNATRPSLRELKELLDSRRHELMRRSTALSLASFAAMYSPLQDADLEEYLVFLKSDAGEQYVQATSRALSRAMLAAAARLGSDLAGARKDSTT